MGADPPWENEVVTTNALGVFDYVTRFLDAGLPKNLG